MEQANTTVHDVKEVVVETLGIGPRAHALEPSTPLLTSVPELDSMAVLDIVEALERRFSIVLDDTDVTAEVFESLTSLATLVESKLPPPG